MSGPVGATRPPEFDLRPATQDDFSFARTLYLSSMQPLLTALDAWDADEIDTAFRGYYVPEEIRFVMQNGRDVGWLQVSKAPADLCLDQLHLIEDVRGQGIGTALINRIINDAARQGRNVSLSLVKGNPALALYRRLGFRRVSEDETKIHMRFETRGAT